MRRIALVLIVGLATAPVAVAAEPPPGTPQFAVSKRGTAVVVPTYSVRDRTFTPFVGERGFTVFARMPRGKRLPTRVLMKYKSSARRCAPSFSLDKGKPIRLSASRPDAQGYAAFSSSQVSWTGTGAFRFCVWMTSRPLARVRPIGNVITFLRDGVGIVQYPARGSTDVGVVTDIASTIPLHLTQARVNCGSPSAFDRDLVPQKVPDFQIYTSFNYQASCGSMASTATVTSRLTGVLALTLSAAEASAGEVRAGGSGLCYLSNIEMSETDARRLIERQGCRVGKLRSVPKGSVISSGNVWMHTVNGAPASMVATGTLVDLVAEP